MAQAAESGIAYTGLRSLFFMLTPNESSYQKLEDVPQYVQQATPFFIGLMVLEMVVGLLKTGSPVLTISDGLTSVSCGMISRIPLLFMRSCELTAYVFVWDRYHLLELPWDSAWTWWLTFVGVDFCYYWVHRIAHEVSIVWAAHQVHHSSEYFNLTTALRQSLTQQFTSWIFYMPLALIAPPTVFAVHIQLNLLYQFWIHTELIRDLGPLEWVFNTPKHHRVHHGTFAEEADKVVFGLVFPINTFEILYVQLHYYLYLWRRSNTFKTIGDKLSTFFKGPSWSPGKLRLGDHVDNPEVTGQEVPHDPSWPLPLQLYVVIHFLLALGTYHDLFENKMMLSQLTVLGMTCYVLLTLTSLGLIMDQRPTAAFLEMLRCVVMVTMQGYGCAKPLLSSLAGPTEAFVSLSLLFWALQSSSQLLRIKKKAH
uniref:Alkylglycerol monooxygenase n=1 Tax=Gasterosteus aculeatus aculeatus TaxID=481459 RepID=G3PH00_GASAC